MSDWERRLQELGLLTIIVVLVLTVWMVVQWKKQKSQGIECIILQPNGDQVIRRGKQCAPDHLF